MAGNDFAKTNKSENELASVTLKIKRARAIPKTASVKLLSLVSHENPSLSP